MAATPSRPLRSRLADAWRAFSHQAPAPLPRFGELAWADPRRLFPSPHGITPYNPSLLVQRQGLQVFDRMRRDEQVKAALAFKKWAVLGGGWELVSPEGQADTWAPKRFVEEVFEGLENTLPDALVDILSALDYGVSVTEQVWETGATRALRGALVVRALETRAPWSFLFEADEYGHLKADGFRQDQLGTQRALPVAKFVLYVHEGLFGNWYGTSDLEAAYRPWWLKENAYKWFAMLLERYGIPPIVALFDPNKYGADPKGKAQEIVTMLERVQAAMVGALPRPAGGDETLTLWAPERLAAQARDVFIPGFDLLDRHIAKALLMPQLLGFTADTEAGSYARSQTHFDTFLLVNRRLQDDLRVRAIERRLVRPLVDLNFGPQPAYPSFRFLPLTKEVKRDLFEVWASMVNARIARRQTTDEAHIRKALDMPEVDEAAIIEAPEPEPVPEGGLDGEAPAGDAALRPPRRTAQRYVWDESEHPRDEDGQWTDADGEGASSLDDRAHAVVSRGLDLSSTGGPRTDSPVSLELHHGAIREISDDPERWRWWTTDKEHAGYFGDVTSVRLTLNSPLVFDADEYPDLFGMGGAKADGNLFRVAKDAFREHDGLIVLHWEGNGYVVLLRDAFDSYQHKVLTPRRSAQAKTARPTIKGPAHPYRELVGAERRVDFAQVGRDLDRLEADAHAVLRTNLIEARDALVAKVERALPDLGLADLDDLLRLSGAPARRAALLAFVRAGFEAGGRALRREVGRFAFQASDASFVPETALRWLRAKAFWITGVLDDGLVEQARLVLLNALKFGELPGETTRKLRDLFEPYVGDPGVLRDGAPIAPHRLQLVLRNASTESFNQGRLVEARDPDLAGLIPAMQYSAILDDRTTEVCRFLDGRLFRTDSDELSRLAPPNHHNCRSLLVPVTLDMTIDEADFLTPSQVGRAIELAGEEFV